MKFKDLLLPFALALVSTWAIQRFIITPFFGSATESKNFMAPTPNQEAVKPLNLEVDFLDDSRAKKATLTEIDTPLAHYVFTSDGAALERVDFKRKIDGVDSTVTTVFPADQTERESLCFLVALGEKTPFYYELIDRKDAADSTQLTYQASFGDGTIQKTFTIFNNTYKVLLDVTISPKSGLQKGIEPRIFIPVPVMTELANENVSASIATDQKGKVQKTTKDSLDPRKGWFAPTLFGLENRYFVHAMVDDPQQFVKRAYYKLAGKSGMFAVLEGHEITKETTWSLAFYFGPKEEPAMIAVDPRLEAVLDYAGWFAPVSRVMLYILNFLYGYLKNYGLAIIALTILLKLLLLPLTLRSEKGMKQQLELKKKLQYVQQRYKNDPETLAREKAELIRKHGMPDMAGCLPLLIQMPVFIGLARILSNSIELYHAPFFGWIHDLSAPDPYYVLPALTGVTMIVASMGEDLKQRLTVFVVATIFVFVTAKFSAGLTLYIFMYNFLNLIQKSIQKMLKTA
jgi:YidC/Oxa1 family membrane protein insertase